MYKKKFLTLTERKKQYQDRILVAIPHCRPRDEVERDIIDDCQRIAFNMKKHTLKQLYYAVDIAECMAERDMIK